MARKQILLIEDNHHDELLTLRALKKANSDTEIAIIRDGADAFDYISNTASESPKGVVKLPDVILLDLKLPRVSGLEILAKLRGNARTRFIPVVVLTSSVEENDVFESYRLGANSYVRKQVDFNAFSKMLMNLELYWLEVNEGLKSVGHLEWQPN